MKPLTNFHEPKQSPRLMLTASPVTVDAINQVLKVWAPPPRLTVSEWADRERRLSPEASSEPGRWSTARAEYARGIMDAINDPEISQVVVMKGSQVGWTEIINNAVGYFIDQDPSPMLVIQPTLSIGKAWSNDRLSPMIRDSPCLARAFDAVKSRDRNNTQLYKKFPGGHVTIAGANSPASLSSRPIRCVLADEVDRYPASAGNEGDPLSLAYKRTATFWNRKRLAGSTPTTAGVSRIEEAFEESDQRRFMVACPDCGAEQFFKWSHFKWTGRDSSSARYACEGCGVLLDDAQRAEMVATGYWKATAPFNGIAGFHVWQAYSPWVPAADMVDEFLSAGENQDRLRVFINTCLGETWKIKGDAPEWQRLYDRAEDYKIGTVPTGAVFLTAGIDVQQNRIEVSIWGWGKRLESWLIDHRVIEGDPWGESVWAALDALISETWKHDGGALLTLSKVAIDSGYATTQVYAWAKRQQQRLVIVVKGVERGSAGVGVPSQVDVAPDGNKKRKRRGAVIWPVVGGIFKAEVYGFLRLNPPTRESGDGYPPGFVHLGKFSDEVFKQLTAEQLVTRVHKFRRRTEWEKTRERNEVLDCRVYARAAAAVFGIDRFGDSHWTQLESHLVAGTQAEVTKAPDSDKNETAVAPEILAPPAKQWERPDAKRGRPWIAPRSGWLRKR